MLIRPVQLRDLNDLLALAKMSSGGITTLPADKRLLHEKIESSLFAFSHDVLKPKGEAYLFVLETEGRVVGCSGILSKTGGYDPICVYHVHREDGLKVLTPERIYDGPAEVGSLFLAHKYRKEGLGRLLSLSRFLFMAIHPDRFDPLITASYRGIVDGEHCPFWEATGERLFGTKFSAASRSEAFLPKHALYTSLLPKEIQKVIEKTHQRTAPALHLLEKQGFTYTKRIDIVDGGPFYSAKLNEIGVVKRRKTTKVKHIVASPPKGKTRMIANHNLHFRAILATGGETLSKEAARLLQIERGDEVSYL